MFLLYFACDCSVGPRRRAITLWRYHPFDCDAGHLCQIINVAPEISRNRRTRAKERGPATGTAPIIFGSGCTTLNEWWVAGAVMSAVNFLLLVLVGSIWRTRLGYILR